MKQLSFYLSFICILLLLVSNVFADRSHFEFMTPRDLMNNDSSSGINLQNNGNSAVTVFGLYVRQFALVSPGSSCINSTIIYSTTENKTAGSIVSPIVINGGKSAAVGSNYLYNMIYNAIYYVNIIYPSSPPGCALPGCTWGSDTTQYNWCIYLGALAPNTTTSSYTSNVPPSTILASSAGNYNYDLINNYTVLGPISCNDQALTCTTANQQTQSFLKG